MSFPIQKCLPSRFRTVTLLSIVFLNVLSHAGAQAVDPSAEARKSLTVARCAQIAVSDPRFAPLAQACQYALSPSNLPSFVCDESVQQFTSDLGAQNWQNHAVITAVVTFEHGEGDKYSNFKINGQAIRALSKPYNGAEVSRYFRSNLRLPAPPVMNFGNYLLWVFDPRDETEFEHKGQMNAAGRTMIVFGFRISKSGKHRPLVGWFSPRDVGSYIGVTGFMWIDEETSALRRIVQHYSGFDPEVNTSAYSTSIDYEWTQISDLGKFLLPAGAEEIKCNYGNCWRDVVTFSNCHKFAGKSRILPAQ